VNSQEARRAVLDQAAEAILSDRNEAYGPPEDNFRDTAELWSAYLRVSKGVEIELTALDVANIMILLKMARLNTSPTKLDHYVDMAGYAGCGAAAAGAHE
jgi:hypothetical protein